MNMTATVIVKSLLVAVKRALTPRSLVYLSLMNGNWAVFPLRNYGTEALRRLLDPITIQSDGLRRSLPGYFEHKMLVIS